MKEKYYRFDVDKFFKDYKFCKKRLGELQREYKDALTSGGMDYSKPKTSGGKPSDMVADKVSKRLEIERKINELNEYFDLYAVIMSELTDDEKDIVQLYFQTTDTKDVATDKVMLKCSFSRSGFFRALGNLRKKVCEIADFEV